MFYLILEVKYKYFIEELQMTSFYMFIYEFRTKAK